MSASTLIIIFVTELVFLTALLLYIRHKVHWQILGGNKTAYKKLRGYYVRFTLMILIATILFILLSLQ